MNAFKYGDPMRTLTNLIIWLGMLIVVPAGLRLIGGGPVRRVAGHWYWGAVPGAVALWLPRGPVAAALAAAYAALTLLLAAAAPARLAGRRPTAAAPARLAGHRPTAVDVAVGTALAAPSVAAVALVAERAGYALFGFEPTVLVLTVAHFHFAGFAAALTAGLVNRLDGGRPARLAAWSVPAGTGVVLLGYFTGEAVELAGALLLTAGMWLVGGLTWRHVRPGTTDLLTRALLGVSAAVLAASMVLAVSWALGEATGVPHPSLGWMAATHGVANALGFALCGILAWRRLHPAPL